MSVNLENSAVAIGLENVSFHSNPKEDNAKECSKSESVSRSVVSSSLQHHGQQPSRLLCPQNSLGKNTGVGCHVLLQKQLSVCLVTQSCPTLVTPQTIACQAPLSMDFSRQKYWSGQPFPSPGDLPNPGNESRAPELQVDSLPPEPPGKPRFNYVVYSKLDYYNY